MCLPSDQVEALHTITAELKAEHERMRLWLTLFDAETDAAKREERSDGIPALQVTRAEAERIFADRIAAHEARLKELGWTRTIRVEPTERTPLQTPMRELVEKV